MFVNGLQHEMRNKTAGKNSMETAEKTITETATAEITIAASTTAAERRNRSQRQEKEVVIEVNDKKNKL